MKFHEMTDTQLNQLICARIIDEFGYSAFLRFIRDKYSGHGDFTAHRHELNPERSVDEVLQSLRDWEKEKDGGK